MGGHMLAFDALAAEFGSDETGLLLVLRTPGFS